MSPLKEKLRQMVLEEIDLCKDTTDEELYQRIDRLLIGYGKEEYISIDEMRRLKKDIFNSIRRLDILQELIEDTSITEIMVNGPKQIFIERNGRIYTSDRCFETVQKLEDVAQLIVSQSNRIINEANPIVDARLPEE